MYELLFCVKLRAETIEAKNITNKLINKIFIFY